MKLTVKRARDIYGAISLLANEPITTHLLNFRLKAAILLLQPHIDTLKKSEAEIFEQHAKQEDGKTLAAANGTPLWKSTDDEVQGTKAYAEILDSEIEVPGLTALPWNLFEKAKCSYMDKEAGVRKTEDLVLPAVILLALGDFIEGEPQAV